MELTAEQSAVLQAIIASRKTLAVADPGWKTPDGSVEESTVLRSVGLAMVSVANLRLWGHDPAVIMSLEAMGLIERWKASNPDVAALLRIWAPPGGDAVTLTPYGAGNLQIVEHTEIIKVQEPHPVLGWRKLVERCHPHDVPEWELIPRRRALKLPRYGREYCMPHPELHAEKKTGRKYVADLETFEETADEGAATRLLGAPVESDPRLKGKRPPKTSRKAGRRKRRTA